MGLRLCLKVFAVLRGGLDSGVIIGWPSSRPRRLWEAYTFPGFCPEPTARGVFGDRRLYSRPCGSVKREGLEWLAKNPFYTRRFATYFGRRCLAETIKEVAAELALDWETVKELD